VPVVPSLRISPSSSATGTGTGDLTPFGSGARQLPGGGTIRRRVTRILTLPLIAVLVLLAVVAAQEIGSYRDARSTSRSVRSAIAVQELVQALQTERGVTAGVLGGNPSFAPELAPARQRVDRDLDALDRLVEDGDGSSSRIHQALRRLDGIESVRAATDAAGAGRQVTFTYYTERIAGLLSVDLGLESSTDRSLRADAAALQALQDHTEAAAQERAFLNGAFSAGGFAEGEYVRFAQMRAARQAALDRFERFATPEALAGMTALSGSAAAELSEYFEEVAVGVADGRHLVVNPQSWWSGMATVLDDLDRLQRHVGSHMQRRAHDLQVDVERRLALIGLLTLAGLAATIHLALLAARSITRPLATMAAEADQVALQRLPEAVRRVQESVDGSGPVPPPAPVHAPARSTEEIRSVAAALDRLQSAAFGLATDQARQRKHVVESLANLGRRNQNLIRRQLGFITALEHEEIDPTALANLFELDHLATRMRRNAASLLVLVGESSPRQWTYPIPVGDVIRAAVSDVEEYRRVLLRRIDDSFVQGTAVGSIAHLLSELIENGLTFSPPDSEVEVHGRQIAEGYLIAVTDQGVGMSSEDLHLANSRLRGEGDFLSAPSRFLGHYVVGRLAQETTTQVELLPSPVNGITARVLIPHSLLAASQDAAVPTRTEDEVVTGTVTGPQEDGGSGTDPLARRPEPPVLEAVACAALPERSEDPQGDGRDTGRGEPEPATVGRLSPATGEPAGPDRPPAHPPRTSPTREAPAPTPTEPRLPDTVSSMLGSHPLVHPFTGDLRITAPNPTRPQEQRAGRQTVAQPSEMAEDPARTRNGLRKRTPRQTRNVAGTVHATGTPVTRSAVLDDSPVQVSSRLTALRAGIHRGQTDAATVAGHGDVTEQGGQRRE